MFDVVFPLNGHTDVVKRLKIDKTFQAMLFSKTVHGSGTMFENTSDKIVRNADIEDAVRFIGQKVNVTTCHKAIMKDVDGRDKPGHDEVA